MTCLLVLYGMRFLNLRKIDMVHDLLNYCDNVYVVIIYFILATSVKHQ